MKLATLHHVLVALAVSAGEPLADSSVGDGRLIVRPRAAVLRVMGCSVEGGGSTSPPGEGPRDRLKRLSPAAQQYLAGLAAFRDGQSSRQFDGKREEARRFVAEQIRGLEPIVFFTRHPLSRPNATGCAIGQSVPERWGCSIRVYDPAQAETPPRTIFQDPEGSIFDMSLSLDAAALFFSYRRRSEKCWQIYEIGVDGRSLRRISRDPAHSEIGAVELPDGDLLFVSTRCGGYLVSEAGPRSNLWVMRRDGSDVRCVSQNTLADFSPHVLPDGRVVFTRWEYVDRDLDYRLGLWTQRPDGRQFQLFFGNTIREVGIFWQAKPVPGHQDLLVATFAPSRGWPHGAIGLVTNRFGPEAPRNRGFAWITDESTEVGDTTVHTDGMSYSDVDDGRLLDLAMRDGELGGGQDRGDLSAAHELEARADAWLDSARWAYRDPFPVRDYLFLVSYGGDSPGRFGLYLLDLCGNRFPLYSDPRIGCYNPLLLRSRTAFTPSPAPDREASRRGRKDPWATVVVADVYRGLAGVGRGRAKYIQIMEQVPKTHEYARRAYDQSPVMGYGTYYAKRCWGRVPIEPDGSAHFDVPAMREIYLQVLDAEGREVQRQTSSIQMTPGEVRSCIGCHEPRNTAPPASDFPMAARRPPNRPVPPPWTDGGLVDFVKVVQPVLDQHCTQCHSGPDPDGGCDLSGDKTRLFNMAYDNLLGRSRAYRQHNLTTGEMLSQEAARGRPLVHFYWLRRAPAAKTRAMESGSQISRIVDYLGHDHCGREISWEDRQRIYAWIDANVPYYATYSASHPLSPGGRDLCTDVATGRESAWYAERFLGVYNRRCASCHGEFPHPNDHDELWTGRHAWINFTHPQWSLALTAHLSKEAGGRGVSAQPFGDEPPLFSHTRDPDYVTMLEAIREGHRQMLAQPQRQSTDLEIRPTAETGNDCID